MDHVSAARLYATRRGDSKPLANNTRLHYDAETDSYDVIFHNTAVVTIWPDGTWTLDTGGWRTKTTRERIEAYSPARIDGTLEREGWTPKKPRPWTLWNFTERGGDWDARGFATFEDGVRIGADGMPVKVTA